MTHYLTATVQLQV